MSANYPWYEEVACDAPLMQGDLIDECPTLAFKITPEIGGIKDPAELMVALQKSAGVQPVRVVVMTQACDLAQGHVQNVILCPIYHVSEFRKGWEELERKHNQNPSERAWKATAKKITDGSEWNLSALDERTDGGVKVPHQIVDFHEVFSLPRDFLEHWLRSTGSARLRLLPPYREHLSQAFARFFMRVGLPLNISLDRLMAGGSNS